MDSGLGVFYQKTHEKALAPTKAHASDSGFDVCCFEDHVILNPGETKKIQTGLKFQIPLGFEIQVRPRSGLSSKGVFVILGTVDSGYRGEVCVNIYNSTQHEYHIGYGDRIAQLVIMRIPSIGMVEGVVLSDTDRGEKGFGSTGK